VERLCEDFEGFNDVRPGEIMKVFLLELNEFNEELLKSAAIEFGFSNIQKLVGMHRTETRTDDTYESDFLEPWVQWLSVHTGEPSSSHGIKHLGDVPHLNMPQIWEYLSKNGKSSGVWGAMNASRGAAEKCLFFLPDPWTASERAYPEEFNQLLDPLRFASKNYLGGIKTKVISQLKGVLKLLNSYGLLKEILKETPFFLKQLIRFRGSHFVFIAFAEYLSTLLFLQCKKRFNPDFSLLFINTLAHLQHHYWTGFLYKDNKKLQLGLHYLDRILGRIFTSLHPEEVFIVANALSQKNTNEESPWILYRPLDHQSFLDKAGISHYRVEAHMTHDAHLFFSEPKHCQAAANILEGAMIEGQKLFLTETYPEDPKKLFYRIIFTEPLSERAEFIINTQRLRFFDFFKQIVQRTGKHIPIGTLYSSTPGLPLQMKNHEIFHAIVQYFQSKDLELKKSPEYTAR